MVLTVRIAAILILLCVRLVEQPTERTTEPTAAQCASSIICPGEELLYEVSWWNVKLGQIWVRTLESKNIDGEVQHRATVFIDSYDGLPFVDLHAINTSIMDGNFYSRGFNSLEKKDNKWLAVELHYDLPNRMVVIEKSYQEDLRSSQSEASKLDTVRVSEGLIQDGISIVYFARANSKHRGEISVPTIISGKEGRTIFQFSGRTEFQEIGALDGKQIQVVPFAGKAEFDGLFGMTGDFSGWFSDDDAAIPVKGEVNVAIGSLKIELIQWKRNGWSPPVEVVRHGSE